MMALSSSISLPSSTKSISLRRSFARSRIILGNLSKISATGTIRATDTLSCISLTRRFISDSVDLSSLCCMLEAIVSRRFLRMIISPTMLKRASSMSTCTLIVFIFSITGAIVLLIPFFSFPLIPSLFGCFWGQAAMPFNSAIRERKFEILPVRSATCLPLFSPRSLIIIPRVSAISNKTSIPFCDTWTSFFLMRSRRSSVRWASSAISANSSMMDELFNV